MNSLSPHSEDCTLRPPYNEVAVQGGREPRSEGAQTDSAAILCTGGSDVIHGLSTEPVPVSAYVGSSKNLKDLNDLKHKCFL